MQPETEPCRLSFGFSAPTPQTTSRLRTHHPTTSIASYAPPHDLTLLPYIAISGGPVSNLWPNPAPLPHVTGTLTDTTTSTPPSHSGGSPRPQTTRACPVQPLPTPSRALALGLGVRRRTPASPGSLEPDPRPLVYHRGGSLPP